MKSFTALSFSRANSRRKRLRQQRNVARPLAQRRQSDFHHAQPEKQILAESPGLDHFLQIFIGRGDQPHIRGQGFVRADPLEGPFAQKTQQLDLDGRVNLADFVQEQRAALGLLETADAPFMGAGERALSRGRTIRFPAASAPGRRNGRSPTAAGRAG